MFETSEESQVKKQACCLNTSGSIDIAKENFRKMVLGSSAYQALIHSKLKELNKEHIDELHWQEIPVITKKNFYSHYSWQDILSKDSYKDIYTILRSSGTTAVDGSNGGFFWPQLKSETLRTGPGIRNALINTLQLTQKSTLAIVGLSLGSWAGGEQCSFALKSIAMNPDIPMAVFSPGNQHAEIIELIEKCHAAFDQIVVALCPSSIFYLERLAKKLHYRLPFEKMSFLVGGEPFPEALRIDLESRAKREIDIPIMISVYSSADTGVLGLESRALILLRQLLGKNPDMARALGFTPYAIPNLFHLSAENTYIELINDELIVTKWQGLPLVRYNLQDRVKLFSWKKLCGMAASYDKAHENVWHNLEKQMIPDVIAVWGRSKGCLFLCGTNIYESMLQEVLLTSSLAPLITGVFVVWADIQHGRRVLHWQIELKPEALPPTVSDVYSEFVELLSKQQPEFASDYNNFYRSIEEDGLRIFNFHFCKSPTLSENAEYTKGIKKKIIVEQGPIR